MTANSLQDRIRNVFVQHLHMEPPSLDKDLLETGIIDSLTFVELLSRLEQEFSIRISLDDLDLNQFRSIALIGKFIGTRLSTETSDSAGLRVAR
jgi:methoxymalonate biosynthesis acyl carrier protein